MNKRGTEQRGHHVPRKDSAPSTELTISSRAPVKKIRPSREEGEKGTEKKTIETNEEEFLSVRSVCDWEGSYIRQ